VTATTQENFGGTTGVTTWRLGVYSTGNGYPPAGTFHAGRFWLAGPAAFPQRIDASQSGDFPNFDPGTALANEAIARTLDADQVNAARWLLSGRDLLVGTFGAEWLVSASSSNDVITPENAKAQRQSTEGSAGISPLAIDNAVVFVHRLKKTLHELAYVFESDAYRSPELSVRSRHLVRPKIAALAFQQQPFRVVWTALADGGLAGLTYLRAQQVLAWHSHRIGGNGKVKSIATISGDGYDELWLSVERAIDGSTVNYIEVLQSPLEDDGAQETAFYLDSGLSYDGAQAATLTPGTGATTAGTTGVTFTAGGSVFVVGDVGRFIDYRDPAGHRDQRARRNHRLHQRDGGRVHHRLGLPLDRRHCLGRLAADRDHDQRPRASGGRDRQGACRWRRSPGAHGRVRRDRVGLCRRPGSRRPRLRARPAADEDPAGRRARCLDRPPAALPGSGASAASQRGIGRGPRW
jgi:hypothetical protein